MLEKLKCLSILIVLWGCSSGDAQPNGHVDREPPSQTPETPRCYAQVPCTCADGRSGRTECSGDISTCSCAHCPTFEPDAVSTSFASCGGDPRGMWRLTSADAKAASTHLYRWWFGELAGEGECPIEGLELSAPKNLRLWFQDS